MESVNTPENIYLLETDHMTLWPNDVEGKAQEKRQAAAWEVYTELGRSELQTVRWTDQNKNVDPSKDKNTIQEAHQLCQTMETRMMGKGEIRVVKNGGTEKLESEWVQKPEMGCQVSAPSLVLKFPIVTKDLKIEGTP